MLKVSDIVINKATGVRYRIHYIEWKNGKDLYYKLERQEAYINCSREELELSYYHPLPFYTKSNSVTAFAKDGIYYG